MADSYFQSHLRKQKRKSSSLVNFHYKLKVVFNVIDETNVSIENWQQIVSWIFEPRIIFDRQQTRNEIVWMDVIANCPGNCAILFIEKSLHRTKLNSSLLSWWYNFVVFQCSLQYTYSTMVILKTFSHRTMKQVVENFARHSLSFLDNNNV